MSWRSMTSDVEFALAGWLPAQRWFAGKDQVVRRVGLDVVGELADRRADGGSASVLTVAEVGFVAGGPPQRYALLLGVRTGRSDVDDAAVVCRAGGEVVYDGTADGVLLGELLRLVAEGAVRGGVRFAAEPDGADALAGVVGAPGRRLGAEQSNTSVVFGDQVILKLFRRLHPGVNPDLELHRALHGSRVAPLLGAIEGEATFGMVHAFYPGAPDGWRVALDDLAGRDGARDMVADAALIGEALAAVHADLAATCGTVRVSPTDLARFAELLGERLDGAVAAVPALARFADGARERYRAAVRGGVSSPFQRIHGDLHLGQVLCTRMGWLLIDFEGEPAVPAEQRREPGPPARDVAGMLRSFDYAAAQAARESAVDGAGWALACREAFLAGYAGRAGVDITADPLLTALELDKAVYEVAYEAGNRPDWVGIPLAAVARLAG